MSKTNKEPKNNPENPVSAKKLLSTIEKISAEAAKQVNSASSPAELEELKNRYLGRKGEIQAVFKFLPDIPLEDRKQLGQELNKLKTGVEMLVNDALKKLNQSARKSAGDKIDITLPGYPVNRAHSHPLSQVSAEITKIFVSLGFQIATGPDIETAYYNFEALNIPEDHPARDLQDTFYIKSQKPGSMLLRTHTSPVQIRVMEKFQPPIRVIVPGRVYRNEAIDATHSAVFHQLEGLAVDENITFADLKATLAAFAKKMFGNESSVRFRPSYFPFTEPSAEMDVRCIFCTGKGCGICKNSGWLETLGCGMVNPKVFDYVKYDKEKYTGFAFGIGLERITMLKFGVDDMRLFYENDLRFLRQF